MEQRYIELCSNKKFSVGVRVESSTSSARSIMQLITEAMLSMVAGCYHMMEAVQITRSSTIFHNNI